MSNYDLTINERMNSIPFSIEYNLECLRKIHSFLFDVETNYRQGLDINDYREIALLLKSLETTCNMNEVNEIFKDIWEYQLFDDGNTRVLLAYKRLHLLRIGRLMAISSVLKIQSSYRIFDEATCRQR